MLPDDNLWNRIEQFELDEPEAVFPFSARLAKETGWTYSHTQRVIQEYKRFTYLACAAGHPVSPSHDVDEVWHLHLTYTQSYWEKFCPEVLQCPLHHGPTKGGLQEGAKFEDWYRRTLESYERFFGPPPEDIWPQPGTQTKPKPEIKVDPTQNWVIPKPPWWPSRFPSLNRKLIPFVLLLVAIVGGCDAGSGHELGPWDLNGPAFLMLYWGLCAVTIPMAFWWRAQSRMPDDETYPNQYVDAVALARLVSTRTERLAQAAIASLLDQGAIEASGWKQLSVPAGAPRPRQPLELEFWNVIKDGGESRVTLLGIANDHAERIDISLRDHGLLLSPESSFLANVMPQLVNGTLLFFGVTKILVGISRNKPVELLSLTCIVLLIWMLVFQFGMQTRLTKRGERYLQHVSTRARYAPPEDDPLFTGMAFAVALDGETELPDVVRPYFQPTPATSGSYLNSSSSSSSSGCSSTWSSSGGASSDGGSHGSSSSCSSSSSSCSSSSSSCGSSGCGGCGGGGS